MGVRDRILYERAHLVNQGIDPDDVQFQGRYVMSEGALALALALDRR